jgi:hypothetical protein
MVTKRTAQVAIVNKTGKKLLSVTVAHKYSDNYKNDKTWELIQPNETTSETMKVEYNTGFGTTGRDWWFVTWADEEGNVYSTSPQNFREIFDLFDKALTSAAEPLKTLGLLVAVGSPEPTSKTIAAAAAATSALALTLLNSESTTGFKQHILRSEDSERRNNIVISNEEVSFESSSGVSKTGFKKTGTK